MGGIRYDTIKKGEWQSLTNNSKKENTSLTFSSFWTWYIFVLGWCLFDVLCIFWMVQLIRVKLIIFLCFGFNTRTGERGGCIHFFFVCLFCLTKFRSTVNCFAKKIFIYAQVSFCSFVHEEFLFCWYVSIPGCQSKRTQSSARLQAFFYFSFLNI